MSKNVDNHKLYEVTVRRVAVTKHIVSAVNAAEAQERMVQDRWDEVLDDTEVEHKVTTKARVKK